MIAFTSLCSFLEVSRAGGSTSPTLEEWKKDDRLSVMSVMMTHPHHHHAVLLLIRPRINPPVLKRITAATRAETQKGAVMGVVMTVVPIVTMNVMKVKMGFFIHPLHTKE
jgi:hypothetical protein